MRAHLHGLWGRWIDRADFDGAGDFYALQALMVRQMVEAGESFCRFRFGDEWLQLQVLPPEMIPVETVMPTMSPTVRAGIEHDAEGRRIAYHILPQRPSDPFQASYSLQPVRVPASDVVHLFAPVEPGQLRGLSWFSPVLLALSELSQLNDAALVRAKLSNLICAALIDPQGETKDEDVAAVMGALEPGTILNLPGGTNLEWFDPKQAENYDAFTKHHLHAIAAGLGLPYELLTGDLASVNYSSIRAGLVEFRKRLAHWQHNIVAFRLCRPVWDRFIQSAVLLGDIDGAAYAASPDDFHSVEWLPPKQQWVDPKSDVEADAAAVAAGFKSRRMVVQELGYDVEQIDAERAMDPQVAPAQPSADKKGSNNV